jgi:hypothetical protein
MIKTRAILETEGLTKIARIRERLDQIRQYKRVIAEEGLEPDAADKQLESELIVRLLRLEKDLGIRPSKAHPGQRSAGAPGARSAGPAKGRGAKPRDNKGKPAPKSMSKGKPGAPSAPSAKGAPTAGKARKSDGRGAGRRDRDRTR